MPQDHQEKIKAKIKIMAFKVEDFGFPHPDPEKSDEQTILNVCTKIKVIGKNNNTTLHPFDCRKNLKGIKKKDEKIVYTGDWDKDLSNILGHHSKMEDFISELAKWIKKEDYEIIKKIKEDYLSDTENFLIKIGCYSKETVDRAINILRKDLNAMRLRNIFFSSKNKKAIKEQEDHYIYKIRSVYRKYFQYDKNESKPPTFIQKLTDNQIMWNMAILLAAMDFLPEKKKGKISEKQKALRYYSKMKKRFEILDKDHNHPDEITLIWSSKNGHPVKRLLPK